MTTAPIIYDIQDIKDRTDMFKIKFQALTTLTKGNKVGIDNDGNLYAEFITQPFLMAIIRKITNQKREDINNYLIKELDEYERFILYIINAYTDDSLNNVWNSIIPTHKTLCLGIVNGLTNLKVVYSDYQPIINVCDKYVENLNLFRNKNIKNLTIPFGN